MSGLGSLLRVAVSLGLVLALLWVAARALSRGRARATGGVDVDVLARVPLAQKSSLAVVRLGEQALVLGITESRVELLSQQPLAAVELLTHAVPDAVPDAVPVTAGSVPVTPVAVAAVPASRVAARRSARQAQPSPLAGSVLSPQTWTKAVATLRELTVRS